nr:hypothetical protein [Paenibacillus koleovorans]
MGITSILAGVPTGMFTLGFKYLQIARARIPLVFILVMNYLAWL